MSDNHSKPPTWHIEQADFVDFMSRLPPHTVDLILTDPPYQISRKTGFAHVGPKSVPRLAVSMHFGPWDDQEINLSCLLQQCYRVLRKGGTAIIFYDLWKVTKLEEAFSAAKFKQLRVIQWQKTNPVPLNSKRNYLTNSREIAVLGVKEGKPTFHSRYDNGIYEAPIPRHNGNRIHPTQKPIQLFKDLVKKHSNPGDLIIDPFLGSGTTAVAALEMERNFQGCDLDPDYTKAARQRMKDIDKTPRYKDLFVELACPNKEEFS